MDDADQLRLRAETRAWRTPLILFVIAACVYALFAWDRVWQASADNHFAHLAESYLVGSLELQQEPPHQNDWASYEVIELQSGEVLSGVWSDRARHRFRALDGAEYILDRQELRGSTRSNRYFVSFPPMPAVLMLPGVAIWGTAFNDVVFTIVFAAFNVALVYLLLRRMTALKLSRLSRNDSLWLTAMFGFGSAHLWCSVLGQVWFTALVVGVTFTLLYVHAAIDAKRPFWAGVALACAFATRTPLLFSVVFFAGFFFFPEGARRRDFGRAFWRDGTLFALAPLVVGVGLMLMNHARFDSFTEFGHQYLAAGQIERIRDYGLFNVHFLSLNLATLLTLLPQFLPHAPWVVVSTHGLAIWVTTPVVLYLLWPRARENARETLWHRVLWATVVAIAVPHIFYQNTGWEQFGYRFSMDYVVYLTALLALGQRRLSWVFKVLILVGVVVNAFGAITFKRMGSHYSGFFHEADW